MSLLLSAAALIYAARVMPSASGYAMRVLSTAGVYALLTIGCGFIFDHAGALSLAKGVFMGVGAYVSGLLTTPCGVGFDAALPASIGLPVLLALVLAIPVLRRAIWLLVSLGALQARQITRARLGNAYALLRVQPTDASAVGIDTGWLRLVAFVLSAGYAELAGSLYVHTIEVLSPDVPGFPVMVPCLTIAVAGSRLRITGAIVGSVTELPEWARFLRDDYMLAFGCILLVIVVAVLGGLAVVAEQLLAKALPLAKALMPIAIPVTLRRVPETRVVLRVAGVKRSFGGVVARDGVSLDIRSGEVLALNGPSGSGKTALLTSITGVFSTGCGRNHAMRWNGRWKRTVSHCKARYRAHLSNRVIGPELSALDNVAVARNAARVGLVTALAAGWRDSA